MISEYDFERLMIQQYVLYKKLVQIQDKVNGRNISRSDIILFDDFKKRSGHNPKNHERKENQLLKYSPPKFSGG